MSKSDIQYEMVDGEMIIKLPRRIEGKSTVAFEKELFHIIYRGTNTKTYYDAEDLEYISLSGLGVLEKLRLEFGNQKLINLKPELYELVKKSGYTDLL